MEIFELSARRAILGLVLLYVTFNLLRISGVETAMMQLRFYITSFYTVSALKDDPPLHPEFNSAVVHLLQSIKDAARLAAESTQAPVYTSEDRLKWQDKNSCKSRAELMERYERRKGLRNTKFPLAFTTVMREYEKLHRTCVRGSGNLTSLFLHPPNGSRNACQFVVAEAGNGLGNRILWMVSTMLYAVLSRRVILIDPRSMIPALMCEPFPGSSWAAPADFPFADLRPDLWMSTDDYIAEVDGHFAKGYATFPQINAARGDDSWGPTSRFYCPTEQRMFSHVKWITLGGCLYFLPELFAIPNFQPSLEAIFQKRIPLTHLLRFAMLPVDSLWAKVKAVEETYLSDAQRLVGVHVRYRGGFQEYLDLNTIVNTNVYQCLKESGILPLSKTDPNTLIFISSLYEGLYDHLRSVNHTEHEDQTTLVQLSKEGNQYAGFKVDAQALVEILCLSLSDTILTSPMSTYSELAYAYGSLSSWVINFGRDRDASAAPCVRSQALDGCYQGAGVYYVCPLDPDVNNKEVMKLVPSLKPCQDSPGLQLVP